VAAVYEFDNGLLLETRYRDVWKFDGDRRDLYALEVERGPPIPTGPVKTMVLDQWDRLYLVFECGVFVSVDITFAGFACSVVGATVADLTESPEMSRGFRDLWTQAPVSLTFFRT
jgi:hypothetical protein